MKVMEIEPLRAIGYDISNAALQTKLYEMGINRLVTSLSQADKATLRYIVLMEHTTAAQQDLGKTLMSPANAIRILKSSFIQLARSIGYIFIPVLQSLLPVIKLVVDTLTWAAEKLAVLLGFELPKYEESDFTNIGDGIEDIGESADEASKKLKNFTLGFDELHVIDTSSTSGNESSIVGNILDGVNLPEYDMLGKFSEQTSEALDRMKESFKRFAEAPATQLALDILRDFWEVLKKLGEWCLDNPEDVANALLIIGGALAIIAAIHISKDIYDGLATIGSAISWVWNLPTTMDGVIDKFKTLKTKTSEGASAFDTFKASVKAMFSNLLRLVGLFLILYGAYKLVTLATKIWKNEGNVTFKDMKLGITDLGLLVTGFGLFLKKSALTMSGGLLLIIGLFFEELVAGVTTVGSLIGMAFAWAGNKIGKLWFNIGYTLGEFFINLTEQTKYLLTLAQNNTAIFFKYMLLFALKAFDTIADGFASLVKNLTGITIDVSFTDAWENSLQSEIDALNLENKQAKQNLQAKRKLAKETKEKMTNDKNEIYDNSLKDLMKRYKIQMTSATSKVEEKYSDGVLNGLLGDFLSLGKGIEDKRKNESTEGNSFDDLDKQASDLKTSLDNIRVQEDESSVETNENLKTLNDKSTENISKIDDLNKTNEIANKLSETANQQASTGWSRVHDQLSNLWFKLDKVQRACENIRINIIHNNYYTTSKKAAGGPVSSGDLFIANEAGPELVGKIGNTTSVANQDQMVAAIAGGVYNAMVSAMSQQKSRPIQVNSYLQVNKRTLATAVTEGSLDNGYDMGLGGINV